MGTSTIHKYVNLLTRGGRDEGHISGNKASIKTRSHRCSTKETLILLCTVFSLINKKKPEYFTHIDSMIRTNKATYVHIEYFVNLKLRLVHLKLVLKSAMRASYYPFIFKAQHPIKLTAAELLKNAAVVLFMECKNITLKYFY